jgi:RNA polymerase sigma-70 factor (ECF subfamily)
VRDDLCDEAIRLAKLLAVLMPDEPEALGLLALMLFQDSRRRARVDADGELVLLEDQDRSLWDRDRVDEGLRVLQRAAALRRVGPYQLQAAIAGAHSENRPWDEIVELYDRLAAIDPSPIVSLNRAVAVALAGDLEGALALVDTLGELGELDGYHLLHAARADLLRRLGRDEDAAGEYRRAIAMTANEPERRYLEKRLAEVA